MVENNSLSDVIDAAVSGLPVVVGGFRDTGLPVTVRPASTDLITVMIWCSVKRALRILISFVGRLIMPDDL